MSWKQKLSSSNFLRVFVSLAFFISGLLVNFVQAILFNTLAYVNINLYRSINYYLTYTIWSQIVALADWWANTQLTIYFADEESKKLMGTHHTMYLMNHNYEIDWLIAWLATDRYKLLGNAKSFAKKSLRWIPIIGWSWIFGEFAFLERSLEKDSQKIVGALNKFLEYEYPFSLLFFAEGTRFTKEKHENSVKFAKERGLPILKHHLLPRTKGFSLCLKTFKEKYPDMLIAQIELRFPKESPPPTFMSLVRCKTLHPDLYLRFIPLHQIPTDSEEEISKYLYDFFKQKDELVDYYNEHDRFPGIKMKVPPNKVPLYNWLGWLAFNAILIPYLIIQLLFNGSWLMISIILAVIFAALLSVNMMVNSTKIKKSSKYGTEASKKQQ